MTEWLLAKSLIFSLGLMYALLLALSMIIIHYVFSSPLTLLMWCWGKKRDEAVSTADIGVDVDVARRRFLLDAQQVRRVQMAAGGCVLMWIFSRFVLSSAAHQVLFSVVGAASVLAFFAYMYANVKRTEQSAIGPVTKEVVLQKQQSPLYLLMDPLLDVWSTVDQLTDIGACLKHRFDFYVLPTFLFWIAFCAAMTLYSKTFSKWIAAPVEGDTFFVACGTLAAHMSILYGLVCYFSTARKISFIEAVFGGEYPLALGLVALLWSTPRGLFVCVFAYSFIASSVFVAKLIDGLFADPLHFVHFV